MVIEILNSLLAVRKSKPATGWSHFLRVCLDIPGKCLNKLASGQCGSVTA